jgi:hypothetical protein
MIAQAKSKVCPVHRGSIAMSGRVDEWPGGWQDRHFDRNISGEEARSDVIRYIDRNSVKRGLVASPEQ